MAPKFTTQSAREAFEEICERAVLSEKAMDALARLGRELAECSRLHKALVIAEAALADIGDADREPGDDVAWCEARAAKALPKVRAALKVTHNADVTGLAPEGDKS